jgi:pyocin large subunit-like protein
VTRRHLLLLALLTFLHAALAACGAEAPVAPPSPVTESERVRYAEDARWAPGQLEAHFQRHPEGYRSVEEYDQGARETILRGAAFTYRDRTTDLPRLGFYDRETNRFTALTRDGGRITTHFRPDRGERYVRNLQESSYR